MGLRLADEAIWGSLGHGGSAAGPKGLVTALVAAVGSVAPGFRGPAGLASAGEPRAPNPR